jgi:cation:H+ antiporter
MSTALVLALFCLGLFFIIRGGDVLVRAALHLNRVTGINHVIIGATFVSVATTLPEVFVSMFAVAAGNHGIAVGNAIGAMIANVGLVMAITLAFTKRDAGGGVKRGDILYKTLFLLLCTVTVFLFAMNLNISWYEGIVLLAGFALFLIFNARETVKCEKEVGGIMTRPARHIERNEAQRWSEDIPHAKNPWLKILLGFIAGQIMLIIGAFTLVENGERLAHLFGISETVVGFTAIALGTSLPELTTAVTSIRRKCGGLGVGNVIGANVINCTLLMGVCGLIGGVGGGALPVSRSTVFVAVPVLLAMTLIAVLPLLIRGRSSRWQGVALIGSYIAYVTYLVLTNFA